MALVSYSKEEVGPNHKVFLWEGATNGGTADTFQAVKLDRRPYTLSFQVEDADAWAAGTAPDLALHGSIDGTNYYALQDYTQTDIDIGADGIYVVGEPPLYIKPVLTNGDAGTDIDVRMLVWFESP